MRKTTRTARTGSLTTTTSDTVPAYLDTGSTVGIDHLTADDVAMPRINLAQAMSDQINKTHPDFIEGVGIGDFFNSVSGTNYGSEFPFSILCAYPPRGVEFAPIEEGGNIIDPNVALDDPRLMFGADGTKPQATRFYDYVIALYPGEPREEVISMSLARSGVRAAKSLNGLARMRGTAIYTGIYTAAAIQKTSQQGSYQTWRFRNAGFIPESCVAKFAALHESLRHHSPDAAAPVVDAE